MTATDYQSRAQAELHLGNTECAQVYALLAIAVELGELNNGAGVIPTLLAEIRDGQ